VSSKLIPLVFFISFACVPKKTEPTVITFAGTGAMGKLDGPGNQASFSNPMGIAIDKEGNLFVADAQNNLIRKIDSFGLTSTLAGTGEVGSKDGQAKEATFFYPTAITTDKQGNIFVADTHNNLVRKIDRNGIVSTLAKNDAIRFDKPAGLAVDTSGNIYVSDFSNRIRMITKKDSIVEIAGTGARGAKNGKALESTFYVPRGIAFDKEGNLLICDTFNNQIRKLNSSGEVLTVSGITKKGIQNGTVDSAAFFHPQAIAIDSDGFLYIADSGNHLIRKIAQSRVVSVAGNGLRGSHDGKGLSASFWNPMGIAVDSSGNIYVADYQNNKIRKISSSRSTL